MNIFRSTYIQLLMFSFLIPSIRTATFKYNPGSQTDIKSQGDAFFMNDGIQLTTNGVYNSTGRAVYAKPVRLWDSATGAVANFSTRFSFLIKVEKGKEDVRGDGLAFFLAPNGSTIPPVSNGSLLGLFNGSVMFNSAQNPAVAVEFDTYHNAIFDPYDSSSCHVGIDINSIKSVNTSEYECSLFLHNQTDAWISYDSSTKYLGIQVSSASANNSSSMGNISLSNSVDVKDILPEWVNVGFTAATGGASETHKILSWEFNWTELP